MPDSGALASGSLPAAVRRKPPRVALLTVRSASGERGGAERLYDGLHAALKNNGCDAHRIDLTSDERDFEHVLRSYLAFYDVDLSAYDAVISTKAPSYVVRHRNHVVYLPHTMRVFYDMYDESVANSVPQLRAQRDIVHRIDTAALKRASVKGIFTVGAEVRDRLRRCNGIDAEVLHHPTTLAARQDGDARHILIAGRLHRWKRVDLALAAVRAMKRRVDVVVTGTGEDEAALRAMAADLPQVRFVGHVSDEALAALYAEAIAVVYCPLREDFGLVCVEAFASGKPVITCTDSGEPARLVEAGVNGWVVAPDPAAMAAVFDSTATDEATVRAMGRRGCMVAAAITWNRVCARLLAPLGASIRAS